MGGVLSRLKGRMRKIIDGGLRKGKGKREGGRKRGIMRMGKGKKEKSK